MQTILSDATKAKLVSALHTFLAAFITALAAGIVTSGTIEWSLAFWGSLALAAVRVAVKSLFENFAPLALGGIKK